MKKDATQQEFLRAGELAGLTDVSTDTLRHYERKGVLPAPIRAANGYRKYPLQALDRVRLIQRALAIGFTLDELAKVLKVRDRGGLPCRQVQDLATTKLAAVEERIAELITLRNELQAIVKDWEERIAQTVPGERSALLDTLINQQSSPVTVAHQQLIPPYSKQRKRRNDE